MSCRQRLRLLLPLLAALLLVRQVEGTLVPASSLPLHTVGRRVVGADGRVVRLACVNWYGAFLKQAVNSGLDKRSVHDIAATIAELGFNCVRLPYGLDMIYDNRSQVPEPSVTLAANPALQERSPFEVFDATLNALTAQGLLVILNNHVSSSGWCCGDDDGNGLWYTEQYPESVWLESLRLMTARYRNNSRVAGFDLRNELRPSKLGVASWGGDGADWSAAAVKGAKSVLAENENMLIIISGLFYGLFLCDVMRRPVHITEPLLRGRTVYTVHEYGFNNFHWKARGVIGSLLGAWCCFFLLLIVAACFLSLRRKRARAAGSEDSRTVQLAARVLGGSKCPDSSFVEVIVAVVLMFLALLGLVLGESLGDQCSMAGLSTTMGLVSGATMLLSGSWLLFAHVALKTLAAWSVSRSRAASAGTISEPLELSVEAGEIREVTSSPLATPGKKRTLVGGLLPELRSPHWLVAALAGVAIAWLLATWVWYGQYDVFERELDSRWGFMINGQTPEDQVAPIWLGEFGTDEDSLWWRHLTRYLRERDVDWAYWAINGEKHIGESETYGILSEDFSTVRHPWKLRALQDLMNRMDRTAALVA